MFADSHAHLDMEQFDPDRGEVIARALDRGVEIILTIGTGNPGSSSIERTLDLADSYEFIYAGIGIHPHDARHAEESYWRKMDRWADHPKVLLWGEIGLDYYYDHSPRDVQRAVFRRQLEAARERGMPVAIHCRDAWDDLLGIVRETHAAGSGRGILHSFTGTLDHAREGAKMGFWISFSGIVTFKNAAGLRETARALPLEHILIETDCPYLAPVPHRGRRNEPAFVVDVARSLAETKGVTVEEIARHTTRSVYELVDMKRSGAYRPKKT